MYAYTLFYAIRHSSQRPRLSPGLLILLHRSLLIALRAALLQLLFDIRQCCHAREESFLTLSKTPWQKLPLHRESLLACDRISQVGTLDYSFFQTPPLLSNTALTQATSCASSIDSGSKTQIAMNLKRDKFFSSYISPGLLSMGLVTRVIATWINP
ncbi:hypothetical protein F4823DRAFT_585063 [Ustulina deusta]|nr:hypothetical protein F4823DRAFT_585063 [Ustulina deusta]